LVKTDDKGEKYWAFGGDFGPDDVRSDNNFCINGIINADRTVQPAYWEVKKVYQNFAVKAIDLNNGIVEIINKYDFTNLNQFNIVWELMSDGTIVSKGKLDDLDIAAHESKQVRLPLAGMEIKEGTEYFIKISLLEKKGTQFIPKGYELAWEQLKMPWFKSNPLVEVLELPKLKLIEKRDFFDVVGKDFKIVFDKVDGTMVSFNFQGTELVRTGLEPDTWRAPVDNDLGYGMHHRCKLWRDACKERKLKELKAVQLNDREVEVITKSVLKGARNTYYKTTYNIYGNGDVLVSNKLQNGTFDLPELPRMGMKMTLPFEFKTITWFGRGEHENYCDRNSGAPVGLYSGSVAEQYFAYVRPQENGNKTDVRWVALQNSKGVGIMAIGAPLLSVNAQNYTLEDFDSYEKGEHRHTDDVKFKKLVSLNLDYKQMGVGGDDSWGAKALPQYQLKPRPYFYRFLLRPFLKSDNLMEISKLKYPGMNVYSDSNKNSDLEKSDSGAMNH
jgi:beta-galactosidase